MITFESITSKVENGIRLTIEEGEFLFNYSKPEKLRHLAEKKTLQMHGENVFYVINQHINYSNVCVLRNVCKFCSFARLKKEDGAYELSIDQIVENARKYVELGVKEIHMVGGLHPTFKYQYYLDMLSRLNQNFPSIQLKCFTAVEINHLARISKKSHEDVLKDLQNVGLKSLTGGGIEVMSERVRELICKQKMGADNWLSIVKSAHKLGLKSNCTILFGHVETKREVLEHMDELRKLQDQTGGFMSFIPLRYHNEGNELSYLPGPDEDYTLRMVAVSRLMLDNIPNIKSYWISMGVDLAKKCLEWGANDIDGTVLEEKVYHMAGAQTPMDLAVEKIKNIIKSANRTPVERDALYDTVPTTN